MQTHPCVVVELALDAVERLREGDRLTLRCAPDEGTVTCLHGAQRIGRIPAGRDWVVRSLAEGDSHEVTVTGFDTDDGGALAHVEIAIAILGEERTERPAICSIISEIGDELRILAMVGAADGRLEPAERSVMEQFAQMRAAELGFATEAGEAAHAVRWARRHLPDILDVAGIVRRLSEERPEALANILETCALVAEVDGRIAPEERQSMVTLRALLEEGMSAARKD
jgi:tellurite resistance protein